MATSYETVQSLEGAGMTAEQAAAVARGIPDQAVERHELELTETRLESRIAVAETRLEARITATETRLEARIEALDARIDASVAALNTKIEGLDAKIDARLRR